MFVKFIPRILFLPPMEAPDLHMNGIFCVLSSSINNFNISTPSYTFSNSNMYLLLTKIYYDTNLIMIYLSFLYQYFPINHGQLVRPVVELIFHGRAVQPTPIYCRITHQTHWTGERKEESSLITLFDLLTGCNTSQVSILGFKFQTLPKHRMLWQAQRELLRKK